MTKRRLPVDPEKMSKQELVYLLKTYHQEEGERPYHPDSMLAMALAEPKEARKIAWRMMHPFAKFTIFVIFGVFLIVFLIIMSTYKST